MMGVTCGAGITYCSVAHAFIPGFNGVSVARSCISLFVLFLLAIILSVLLRCTASDYPFGIFKLFLQTIHQNVATWA